jgi:DNA mismatch repair ATPase MutL
MKIILISSLPLCSSSYSHFNFNFSLYTLHTYVQLEPLIVQAYNDSLAQAQRNESHTNHTQQTQQSQYRQQTQQTQQTQHTQQTQDGEQDRGGTTDRSPSTSSLQHRLPSTPPSHTKPSRTRSLSQTPPERTPTVSTDMPLNISATDPDLSILQPLVRSSSSISDSTGKKKRVSEIISTIEHSEKLKMGHHLNMGVKNHHRHAHRTHSHHSQANCLFFVDPCTSLELMSPSADEPTQGSAQGIPVQAPQAAIPSKFFTSFCLQLLYPRGISRLLPV